MIQKEQGKTIVYSDGVEVEEQMLSIAKEYPEDLSQDYIAKNSNYTINNTFSSVRRNILNWYPFQKDADILEVGAGMGSCTGLFCDVARHVTALEMSEKRADVIRARYPDRKNLEVICGNINSLDNNVDISIRKYDYIIFVGVLEYAGVFSDARNPYAEFLLNVKAHLKERGKILFAIENRFGLKYFAGASEDHISQPFVGIKGYQGEKMPKTFSKAELEELLMETGFSQYRFYYVFPDYKFPTIISTDDMMPSYMAMQNVSFTHAKDSMLLFDEKKIYKDIIENKRLDFFANSFLVEASMNGLEENHVIYVSAKGESKKEYRVSTIIDSSGNVIKKAMHPQAREHIKNEFRHENDLAKRGIKMLDTYMEEGCLRSKMFNSTSAQDYFVDILSRNDREELVFFLDKFQNEILKSSDYSFEKNTILQEAGLEDEIRGDIGKILKDGYIDMTFYNAFYKNGEFIFYDQEWRFSNVPADFILYYAIKSVYQRMNISTDITFKEIMSLMKLEKNQEMFEHLENYIWSTVLYRQTDFYGEDGYCNRYCEEHTLAYKVNTIEKNLRDEIEQREMWKAKADTLSEQKATCEKRIEEQKTELEQRRNELIQRDAELLNKSGHIELLLQSERDLQNKLFLIESSRAFRFVRGIWKMNAVLFPPGSARKQWLGRIKKAILKPFRREKASVVVPDLLEQKNYETLCFSIPQNPIVSIVIPVYNEFDYTYECLKSISDNSGEVSYEIILADDCSTDITKNIKDIVTGITVSRTEENVRFLRNCNHAAKQARGKYIIFLNNDTQVRPDWLQPLVDLLDRDETIGMTGSKLIFADGTLQEAGGILWKDGSGWNYGRGSDPSLPEYNYVKDVDYISGASLMIRRELWEDIGGFDERYVPAYCEDSDLAFEVRRHGYRVVYQPKSEVVHFEGISNGTDLNNGIKKYQVDNNKKLQEKWHDEFNALFENGNNVFRAREKSKGKKIILFVDHYVPQFDKDAGSRTVYQYLQMFVEKGFAVKFLGDNFYPHEPYTSILQQMGIEVLYGTHYASHIKEWISDNKENIDFVFLNRPHIAEKYIDIVKKCGIRTIYYGHDLHFLRIKREYELSGDTNKLKEAEQWRERELKLLKKADISYYPSSTEISEIKNINPDIAVKTITAYIFDLNETKEYQMDDREGLLFVGGFGHPPNVDGIMWFVKKVWPEIRKSIQIPLYIVGSHPTKEIEELDGKDEVYVKGFVSDEELDLLYQQCRIVIVPLRYGAGVKGKVVEALAKGAAVVTTDVGAEGIPEIDKAAVVVDNPEKFGGQVVSLYKDVKHAGELSIQAQALIKRYFSKEAVWSIIKGDFCKEN